MFYFAPPHAAVNRSALKREKGTRCRSRLIFTVVVGYQAELAVPSQILWHMTSGHGYGKARSGRKPRDGDAMSTIQVVQFSSSE